jgi:hypothetical protein
MFNALIDFAEEPAGFKILHTTQSISLHVYSFMLCLQLFFSMMAKFTLMRVHSHFTLFLYAKKTCCVYSIYKKFERRNQLNFKLQWKYKLVSLLQYISSEYFILSCACCKISNKEALKDSSLRLFFLPKSSPPIASK